MNQNQVINHIKKFERKNNLFLNTDILTYRIVARCNKLKCPFSLVFEHLKTTDTNDIMLYKERKIKQSHNHKILSQSDYITQMYMKDLQKKTYRILEQVYLNFTELLDLSPLQILKDLKDNHNIDLLGAYMERIDCSKQRKKIKKKFDNLIQRLKKKIYQELGQLDIDEMEKQIQINRKQQQNQLMKQSSSEYSFSSVPSSDEISNKEQQKQLKYKQQEQQIQVKEEEEEEAQDVYQPEDEMEENIMKEDNKKQINTNNKLDTNNNQNADDINLKIEEEDQLINSELVKKDAQIQEVIKQVVVSDKQIQENINQYQCHQQQEDYNRINYEIENQSGMETEDDQMGENVNFEQDIQLDQQDQDSSSHNDINNNSNGQNQEFEGQEFLELQQQSLKQNKKVQEFKNQQRQQENHIDKGDITNSYDDNEENTNQLIKEPIYFINNQLMTLDGDLQQQYQQQFQNSIHLSQTYKKRNNIFHMNCNNFENYYNSPCIMQSINNQIYLGMCNQQQIQKIQQQQNQQLLQSSGLLKYSILLRSNNKLNQPSLFHPSIQNNKKLKDPYEQIMGQKKQKQKKKSLFQRQDIQSFESIAKEK